jgi:hypothetical protein
MRNDDTHISDSELIATLDGEVTGGDAARIQEHLAACWQCRSRRARLEHTIVDFVQAHQRMEENLPLLEMSGAPRERLRARLKEAQLQQKVPMVSFRSRRLAFASLAMASVLALGIVMYFSVQQVGAASIPNALLTPGATRSASRADICTGRNPDGFYPIPATLAYRVFEKYRIANPGGRSYEVDYLITPALGGADDIRNLWPQPFSSGEWNAHVKDALEDHLYQEVCAGNLELVTAQRDISTNWIAAYRKYFKTDRPLASHASFSIDPPWED